MTQGKKKSPSHTSTQQCDQVVLLSRAKFFVFFFLLVGLGQVIYHCLLMSVDSEPVSAHIPGSLANWDSLKGKGGGNHVTFHFCRSVHMSPAFFFFFFSSSNTTAKFYLTGEITTQHRQSNPDPKQNSQIISLNFTHDLGTQQFLITLILQ